MNIRCVQDYCKSGRVPGAKKCGVSWLVPSDAKKPRDPRSHGVSSDGGAAYLSCVLLSSATRMPRENPDAALLSFADEAAREQFKTELSYMRGDFEAVKARFQALSPDDATYLCAANITVCAAMSTRDYELFKNVSSIVKQIELSSPSRENSASASLLPVLAQVSMNAPRMAPEWLVRGDFSAFSEAARPMLVFMRVKYLQSVGDFSGMLAAAQTAISVYASDGGVTLTDIYLNCLCACACYALGRIDEARRYIDGTVGLCEPMGFVTPLGEYSACLGGLLEVALKKTKPDFERAVRSHIDKTFKNWIFFHNEFARDNVTLILSAKEYQFAVLLKEGKTYKEIAERMRLSLGRTRNLVTIVYEKLGISQKSQIKRFVY